MFRAETGEKPCNRTSDCSCPGMSAEIALDGDPKIVAKRLVSLLPLDNVCENKELMDAFLSEMFLALARASSRKEHRQRQAEGIVAAKARGVQFGKKTPPLPDNFDIMRRAWRNGEYNLIDAAKLCGMAKSTFYSAVLRVEEEALPHSRTG